MKTHTPKRFRRGIYLLPNLFTLAAMYAGFFAIVMATAGHFERASIAILIAILLDGLDGRVARMTHTQSDFGAQLDSLSDMVSFGIAPAVMIYLWSLHELGKLGYCIAFIFAMCGALRLARFNADDNASKRFFYGLAIPVPAAVLASFTWLCHEYHYNDPWIAYALIAMALVLGYLEISVLRYRSFKDIDIAGKVPFHKVFAAVLFLILVVYNPPLVIFAFSLAYAMTAPSQFLYRRLIKQPALPVEMELSERI